MADGLARGKSVECQKNTKTKQRADKVTAFAGSRSVFIVMKQSTLMTGTARLLLFCLMLKRKTPINDDKYFSWWIFHWSR